MAAGFAVQTGGLMTDEPGYIVKEWRYDPVAHMPPPPGILVVKLNRSITFEFRDRSDMRVKFAHEGVSRDLDAGMKPKREGNYLDTRYCTARLAWYLVVPYVEVCILPTVHSTKVCSRFFQ